MATIAEGGPALMLCATMAVAPNKTLGNDVVVTLSTQNGTGRFMCVYTKERTLMNSINFRCCKAATSFYGQQFLLLDQNFLQ